MPAVRSSGATSFGFFVEYDRGTERAREYAAKLRAYYSFRDSPSAARDYAGFPTLLFVSTSAAAEARFACQAFQVWLRRGGDPLPVLLSTTDRIVRHAEGILGPIWRTPLPAGQGEESKGAIGCRKVHHTDSWESVAPSRK